MDSAMQLKTSIGLITCRMNTQNNQIETILVQKRYSLAFSEFIHCHYSINANQGHLIKMFNNMTINERLLVKTLDFDRMWYHIWIETPVYELYHKKYQKFRKNWLLPDNGKKLISLINQAKGSGTLLWEIPKGKPKEDESDLTCAIREFEEETGITREYYQILPEFKKSMSYFDGKTEYKHIYFLAMLCKSLEEPNMNLSLQYENRIAEISKISWQNMEAVRFISKRQSLNLEPIIGPAFNFIKNYLRYKH